MKIFKCLTLFSFPLSLFATLSFEKPWGKDSDLIYEKNCPEELLKDLKEGKKFSLLGKMANKIIIFKQKVISPVDGPRSHFRPTSSRYMQLAIYRYGFFKGFIMGCDRLLRENDEKWVYRTIVIDNVKYKYDPAIQDKYFR